MSNAALRSNLPSRRDFVDSLVHALVVAATLYVLDGSLRFAAASAGFFLALLLAGDVAEAVVGDYADHVLFGLLVLGFTAYAADLSTPIWLLVAGVALGGWFLVDGVQHLRHGKTRDEVSVAYEHDGGALTGIARALVERLLAPIRLGL
ncbi:hypothetical protein [Halomicrobium salinisoli]|uniref:hypothetical protein n=1 Tax=Halomicrobium salinisoli TaxID=2878391 RepID=UPI001CEFC0A7|nr:hypothetical protein [Halomicrobium salinisoli]